MGLGANIWSETGHGEGRLGDSGKGGRQGGRQKSFFWVYFGCVGERRVTQLPEKRGERRGLLGWGSSMPGKQKRSLLNPCRVEIPKRRGDYLRRAGDVDPGDERKSFTPSGATFSARFWGFFRSLWGVTVVKETWGAFKSPFCPDSELPVLQQGPILPG